MKKYIRKWFEVLLIKIARKILIDRNVQRSTVVSRKDNNEMRKMAEHIESIEKRMLNNYK